MSSDLPLPPFFVTLSEPILDDPSRPPKDGRCIINELPAELLSYIFVIGLTSTGDGDTGEDPDEDEEKEDEEHDEESDIPRDDGDSDFEDVDSDDEEDSFLQEEKDWEILITQVCRRWRDVAIATPQLWSEVELTADSPLDKSKVYLERSKEAPVNINVDYSQDNSVEFWELDSTQAKFSAILDVVRLHISHTNSLLVSVAIWHYMSIALMFLGSCPEAPILKELELYHHGDPDDEDEVEFRSRYIIPEEDKKPQGFVLFQGNTPRLKQVVLWGVHLNWETSTFLKGLRCLELSYHDDDLRPSFKEFARILQDSPNLELLTLSDSGPAGGPVEWLRSVTAGGTGQPNSSEPISTEIHLPSVKEFVIAFAGATYASDLMQRLVFTNLTNLTLDFESEDYTEFIASLAKPHPITQKSILADLTSLFLGGVGECRKSSINEMAAALPKVTTMRLNFHHLSLDWYTALFPEAGSKPRINVPRLDTLFSMGLDGEQLKILLEARKAAGAPLSRLYINREDYVEEEQERWFRKESGLKTFDFFEDSDDEEDDLVELETDDDDDIEDEWDHDDDIFGDDLDDEDEDEDEGGAWSDVESVD